MATIALYMGKMNQMPSLLNGVKKSVEDYSSELFSLKSKTLNIRKSVCDLDDVIGMVQTSTQIQDEKMESLEMIRQKTEEFVEEVIRIDEEVADFINQSKENFYNKYNYLKPDAEKNFLEKWFDDAAEWCKEHWESICNVVFVIVVIAFVVVISVVTCGWGPVIVAGLVGAAVGAGGQLLSDVISWAVTGKWESSWEDYVGAALGGMVGGLLLLSSGNISAACFMDGMVSTLLGESLKSLTGRSDKTNEEIWGKTIFSAAISGILGKGCDILSKKVAKPIATAFPKLKRLSGRGSYGASYQMVLTKLKNKTIKGISVKTLRNGFISGMWGGLFSLFFNELTNNSVKQLYEATKTVKLKKSAQVTTWVTS